MYDDPNKTIRRGENLNQELLNDFRPFMKDLESFERMVKWLEEIMESPCTRIDSFPFHDGRPGIMEKHYYFGEEDSYMLELNAIAANVESL